MLSRKKERLKPAVTLVRDGGCVDGKADHEIRIHATNSDNSGDTNINATPDACLESWEVYGSCYHKAEFSEWARSVGVNEHIRPRVGDTLAIVPAMMCSRWSR